MKKNHLPYLFLLPVDFFLEQSFCYFVWFKPKLISCLIDLFVFFKASGVVPSWYVSFSLVSLIHLEGIWFEIFSGEGNPNEIWIWKGKKYSRNEQKQTNYLWTLYYWLFCWVCVFLVMQNSLNDFKIEKTYLK